MLKKLSMKDYLFIQDYITNNISANKRIESIHGFMTAIICSPSLIKPSEWMGYIFEDENGEEHDFKSEKTAKEIIEIIMSMYNDIAHNINETKFKPLLSIDKNEITPDDAKLWCKGFLEGLSLWDEDFKELIQDENFIDIIIPMLLLNNPDVFFKEAQNDLGNLSEEEKNKLKNAALDTLAECAIDLRYYFIEDDPNAKDTIKEKIGRNEPCPCGSGKKYKKCCGN
jgi:uncharacterized protein